MLRVGVLRVPPTRSVPTRAFVTVLSPLHLHRDALGRHPKPLSDQQQTTSSQQQGVLKRKKKVNGAFAKKIACSSYVQACLMAIGGWQLVAIGGWRLTVGGWRQLVVGDW